MNISNPAPLMSIFEIDMHSVYRFLVSLQIKKLKKMYIPRLVWNHVWGFSKGWHTRWISSQDLPEHVLVLRLSPIIVYILLIFIKKSNLWIQIVLNWRENFACPFFWIVPRTSPCNQSTCVNNTGIFPLECANLKIMNKQATKKQINEGLRA